MGSCCMGPEYQQSILLLSAGEILGLWMFKGGLVFVSLPVIALFSLLSVSFVSLMTPPDRFSFLLYPFSSAMPHSGFSFYFPFNLALHTLLFQSQFVSQTGDHCLSEGGELCPVELLWSDKQAAADWTGTGLAGVSSGLNWATEAGPGATAKAA